MLIFKKLFTILTDQLRCHMACVVD